MRAVTNKLVQTHFECVCGHNEVDHQYMKVKWADLRKIGVVRKLDKSTGKPFLLQIEKSDTCHCFDSENPFPPVQGYNC